MFQLIGFIKIQHVWDDPDTTILRDPIYNKKYKKKQKQKAKNPRLTWSPM